MTKNLPTINSPDMLSTADIAKMLDVTPKTVSTHYTKRPDFPFADPLASRALCLAM